MEFNELNPDKEVLLNQIYSQGIQENEKNTNVWKDYKEKHEKVIDGLKAILPELSLNCMVPLGKKALMKGKLVHTNEILVCIGDGYFVKYSNEQAIELCNRRINHAEDMLKKFEKERNLFELRQMLPLSCGAFADDDCKEILEYSDETQLENWKVEHRNKVKEYHQKLFEMKNLKKEKIETEDDLFKRLDQLELEEELADELDRLEQYNFFDENSDETEASIEEDEEEIEEDAEKSKEDDNVEIEKENLVEYEEKNKVENKEENPVEYEEKNKVENEEKNAVEIKEENVIIENKEKEVCLGQIKCKQENIVNITTVTEHLNHDTNLHNNEIQNKSMDTKICDSIPSAVPEVIKKTELSVKDTKINGKFEVSIISEDEIKKMLGAPSTSTNYNSKGFNKKTKRSMHSSQSETEIIDEYNTHCEKSKVSNRRVSFATPHFIELKCPSDHDSDSEEDIHHDQNSRKEDSITEHDSDETIIIDFKHSDVEPLNIEGSNNEILSPKDIYRLFCTPKSILKRTQHMNYVNTNIPLLDESIEEEQIPESEMDSAARSTYNLVVQDIQERSAHLSHSEPSQLSNKKRKVSKFKLERQNVKKLDT